MDAKQELQSEADEIVADVLDLVAQGGHDGRAIWYGAQTRALGAAVELGIVCDMCEETRTVEDRDLERMRDWLVALNEEIDALLRLRATADQEAA